MKNLRLLAITILFAVSPLFAADYVEMVNSGLIFLKQGMAEEAIRSFEDARDIQPSSPITYYYLGEAYYMAGKNSDALDNYKKAIELEDSNPDYHYSLAQLYLSEGNTEQALEELTKTTEIAPSSIKGKQALRLKEKIQSSLGNKEMVEKWARLEEEGRKKKEEEKTAPAQQEGNMPPGFEGLMRPGEAEVKQEEVKIPIEQLMKRVKYGTESVRQKSSAILMGYEQPELMKVATDITDLVVHDRNVTVRKNMIIALGKTATQEAADTLLGVIKDKNEKYDIKITVLDGLSDTKTEDVAATLRNVLKTMVEDRETARAEAKKNIQDITTKIDNLEAQKIKLNMDISEQRQKVSELQMKLQFTEMPMGGEVFTPGMQPTRASGSSATMNVQEIQKLRTEIRKIEDTIKGKETEIAKTDAQLADLMQQKGKYEMLLAKQEKKRTDISMPGRVEPVVQQPDFAGPPGMSGVRPDFFPGYAEVRYEETDEEKNEVVFALKLLRTIGEMRDTQALSTVKKGWDEYGIDTERIYYLLTLARLGDFSGMAALIERLGQDYPQDAQSGEIALRRGIIGMLGEYLIQNPDARLKELIEFLSEEDSYPEIRGAASGVLSSMAKTPVKQ